MPRTSSSSIVAANQEQLLFLGRGLNFQLTTDQALAKQFSGTNFLVTHVVAVRKSGGATVACAGGVYSTTAKGGSAIVAAVQSWVTLASGILVNATVAAITAVLSSSPIYLSLTTGSTAAVTADVYVYGVVLD
jgi:hypothetical protein